MEYRVVIKEFGTDEIIKELKWTTARSEAESIEGGLTVNLNHEKFYTIIEERRT
ncbi:hypothetical protein ACFQZE_06630 [Paenibacillus sp. GCM10027627]|uniref:hypothetical protein n=1 Tax=unclassified Paenibacillus TaxID=185978 RepID=UPI0036392071